MTLGDQLSQRNHVTEPGIYCTLGNTTDLGEVVSGMIKAGMTGARINTAYCDFEDYTKRINLVKAEARKLGFEIPIMMDIKGPQLRLLTANPDMGYSIERGIVFPIGFHKDGEEFKPDPNIDLYMNYDIKKDLKEGDTILIENGTMVARVLENNGNTNGNTMLQVVNEGDGVIRNKMGVNVPGRYLTLPHLCAKDKAVIDYTINNGLDYIALSFVRDEQDLDYLQKYVKERATALRAGKLPGLIAKIEDKFGCINLGKIVDAVDDDFDFMVMIARGDLFNEINYSKLAFAQQRIARYCRQRGVPFMIGTGLLESMKYHPRPTRAEVCDVWNACRDNPQYLMLSAETSNGKNPVLAVSNLAHIVGDYYRSQAA